MIQNYENWLIPATVAITTTIVVGAAFGGYIYYQNNQTNAVIVKLQEEIDALKLTEVNLREIIADPTLEHKTMELIRLNESLINKVSELTVLREQEVSKLYFWKIDPIFQHIKEGISENGFVSIYDNIPLLQKKFKASDLYNYLLDKTGGDPIQPNSHTPIDINNLQQHLEKVTPNTGELKKALTVVGNKVKEKISMAFDHAQETFNYTPESVGLAETLQTHMNEHLVTLFTACDKTFLKIMTTFSTWSPEAKAFNILPVDATVAQILTLLTQDGVAAFGIASLCYLKNDAIRDIPLNLIKINMTGFVPLLKVNSCVYSTTQLLLQEMQLFNILILKYGATFLAQNPHIMDYLKTHPDDLVTLQQLFFISKTSVFSNCLPDIDLITKYLVKSDLKNTIPWIEFYNNFIKVWNILRFLSPQ